MKNGLNIKKCLAAFLGIFFVGAGVAFNAQAGLGNDPVGIFYDGIRNFLGLSEMQLGTASNVVNITLVVFLVFAARKYINVGTLIYILPYGIFVDAGTSIYQFLFANNTMPERVIACIAGCLCIFLGVAIFIVTDIGVDPLTGVSLFLADKLKCGFDKAKILFDVSVTIIGFLLGGTLGVITLVTSFAGGPTISLFTKILKPCLVKVNRED